MLSGSALPMLVALVTARVASGSVKSVMLAVLSAVAGIVNELVAVGGVLPDMDWNSTVSQAVLTFLIAVGLHFGLLKPAGVTGSDGSIQTKIAGGVGYRGRHRAESW